MIKLKQSVIAKQNNWIPYAAHKVITDTQGQAVQRRLREEKLVIQEVQALPSTPRQQTDTEEEHSGSKSQPEEEKQQLEEGVSVSAPTPNASTRLARFYARRETQHEQAMAEHREWQTQDHNHRQDRIQSICANNTQQTQILQEQIHTFLQIGDDPAYLISLSTEQYAQREQKMQQLMVDKRQSLLHLEQQLLSVEEQRLSVHQVQLLRLVPTLINIAHLLPDAIHNTLQSSVDAVNQHVVRNHQSIQQLIHKLTAQLETQEQSDTQTFTQQTQQWRQVRHRHTIQTFQTLLNDPDYTQPTNRQEQVKQLRSLHENCLSATHSLLEALLTFHVRYLTGAKIETIQKEIERRIERLRINRGRIIKRINKMEDYRLARLSAELQAVQTACDGYTSGTVHDREREIQLECREPMQSSHAAVLSFIQQTEVASEAHINKWMRQVHHILHFFTQAAHLHLSYTQSLQTQQQTLQTDLQQLQSSHQQQLAALESQLQEAVSKMKQSESMETLEIHKQQVWDIVAEGQEGGIGRAYHQYPEQCSAVLLAADQSLQQLSISTSQQMAALLGLQSEQDKQKQDLLREEEKRRQQAIEEEQRRNEEKQEAGKKKGAGSSTAAASASSATAAKTKTKKNDKEKEEEEKKQKLREEELVRQKQEAEVAAQKLLAQRCVYTLMADITHTETSSRSPPVTSTSDSQTENQAENTTATVCSPVADDQRVFYKLISDAELLEQLSAGTYLHIDMRSNEEKRQAEREAEEQERLNQQRQLQELEAAQQRAVLEAKQRDEEEHNTKTTTKNKLGKGRITPVSTPKAADSRKKQKDVEKEEKEKLEKEKEQQFQQEMAELAVQAERQRVLAAEQAALIIPVDTNGTAAMVPFILNQSVILSLLIKARESWMMLIASLHTHMTTQQREHRHTVQSEQMKDLEIQTRQLRPRWHQQYSPIYQQRQTQLRQHIQLFATYIKQQEQQQQQQCAATDTEYHSIEKQALVFDQYIQQRITALQQVKSMSELYAVNQQVEQAKSKLEQEGVQPLMRLSTQLDTIMQTATRSHAAYIQRLQNACFSASSSTTSAITVPVTSSSPVTYHSAEIGLYQGHLEEQQKLLVVEVETRKQRLSVLKDRLSGLLSVSAYEVLRQSVSVEISVQHGLGDYGLPKRRLVTTAYSVYAQHHSNAQEAQAIIQQLQAFHQQHIHPHNTSVEFKPDPQLSLKCLTHLDSLRLCLYRRAAALQCLKPNLPWSAEAALNTPLVFTAEAAAAAAPISARVASVSAAVLSNSSPPTSARNKAKSSSIISRSPVAKKTKEDKAAAEQKSASARSTDQGPENQHMMVIIQQAIHLCQEETKVVMKNYLAAQVELKKKLLADTEITSPRPNSRKGKKEDSTGSAAATTSKAQKKKEVVEVDEIVLPVWLETFCQQEWAKAMALRQTSINLLMEQMIQTQTIVKDMIATIFLSTLQHLQQQTLAQQQVLQQGYTLINEALHTDLQQHHLQLKPALMYQSPTELQNLIAAEQQRRHNWYDKTNEYYQQEREYAEKQAWTFVRELHHAAQCLCRLSEGWLLPCDLSIESKDDVWSSIMATSSARAENEEASSKKKGEKDKNGKKPRDNKVVSSPRSGAGVSAVSPLSVSYLTPEEQQRWNRIEWPGIKFTEMKWSPTLPAFVRVRQPQSLATVEDNKTATSTADGKSLTPQQQQKDKSSAAESKKVNADDKKLRPANKPKTLDSTHTPSKTRRSSTNGTEAVNGGGASTILSPRGLLPDAENTAVLSTLNLPFIPVIFQSRDSAYQQYLQQFQQHHKHVLQQLEKYAERETVTAAKWEQQLNHLLQQ